MSRRMPYQYLILPLIALLAILSLIALPAHAQEAVSSGQRVSLGRGSIELWNVAGTVTLRRGSGEAAVTATAGGADGGQLRFFVDRGAALTRFRVVYPEADAIAGPFEHSGSTNLRLRRDGTFGGDNGWRDRGDEIRVGGSRGFRGYADIELTVPEGSEVKVHLAVGRSISENVSGRITIDTWSADAQATGIAGEWSFDTGSGDVVVRGARGTLRIDTGSGDAAVTDLSGDLLDVDTGSGEADATNVQVARFRFDTGSGNVRARGLQCGRGVVDTGSGDADIEITGGAIEDILIDTGSGDAVLALPQGADARLMIDTGSGAMTMQRTGAVLERRDSDGMVLRLGDGRGRIKIDTGSGDVTIR
jgi:hypothetical protein